ncbi:hypothetical protein GCM10011579_096810 [Streptomyces albiflavescens]|uniref:Uncharacterized protein n=1 Tax=Streptomyces albiflavescens TaxID=1623582 RepID=A0A917YFI5_9ACTN|nr:hypothetical protein GCM10011579_096810 [Streptomyces albiflavescens]
MARQAARRVNRGLRPPRRPTAAAAAESGCPAVSDGSTNGLSGELHRVVRQFGRGMPVTLSVRIAGHDSQWRCHARAGRYPSQRKRHDSIEEPVAAMPGHGKSV